MTNSPEHQPFDAAMPDQHAIDDVETIEKTALQEVEELLQIQAPQGIPREERGLRNAVIRERLASASDLVVAWAFTKGVNVAEKELMKRFQEERAVPLKPLIHYWFHVKRQFETQYDWKIFGLIQDNIPRYALSASQDEILSIFKKFITVVGIEKFLVPTLSWRDDLEEIGGRVMQETGNITDIEYRQFYQDRAVALRNQREANMLHFPHE